MKNKISIKNINNYCPAPRFRAIIVMISNSEFDHCFCPFWPSVERWSSMVRHASTFLNADGLTSRRIKAAEPKAAH